MELWCHLEKRIVLERKHGFLYQKLLKLLLDVLCLHERQKYADFLWEVLFSCARSGRNFLKFSKENITFVKLKSEWN